MLFGCVMNVEQIKELTEEHCFAKKELKSSAFLLKSFNYSFPWKRGGMRGTFLGM